MRRNRNWVAPSLYFRVREELLPLVVVVVVVVAVVGVVVILIISCSWGKSGDDQWSLAIGNGNGLFSIQCHPNQHHMHLTALDYDALGGGGG